MAEFDNWATSPRASIFDNSLTFDSPILKEACETWHALAENTVPPRSRFSARAVKNFVGHLVIFERQAEDILIRLMGTRISAVIGEMQGKTLTQVLLAEVATRWTNAIDAVITAKKPIRVVTTTNFNDLNFLEAEIFMAPLCDEHGITTMVFAAVVFRSGVTRSSSVSDLVGKK